MNLIEQELKLSLDELFAKVNLIQSDTSPPEKLPQLFRFLNDIQDNYEPAIFILNMTFYEGIFYRIFKCLLELIDTKCMFSSFHFLADRASESNRVSNGVSSEAVNEFKDKVVSIMTVEKNHSQLIINSNLVEEGRYNNDFFDIIINSNRTPNTDKIITYLMTNRFNFKSYFNTICEKVKFSYTTRRETINNRKVNKAMTSEGDSYILTENYRVENYPWLISHKITNFKIFLDGDKCTTGGRPGIPGSIYFTMHDRTSMILFKRGTCLIVGSKSKNRMNGFLRKTIFNIRFQLQIFVCFMESKYHTRIVDIIKDIVNCTHQDIPCDECLKSKAVENEVSGIRYSNVSIEYLRNYNKYYNIYKKDYNFLTDLLYDIDNEISPIADNINKMDNYILANTDSIINNIKVAVFGLRRIQPVFAGIFLQMPESHRKHISLFNGNRITYRSLKKSEHAASLIALYEKILEHIKSMKQMDKNIFDMSDEEISNSVDVYSSIFHEYR